MAQEQRLAQLEEQVQQLRIVTDRAVELLAERETVQRFRTDNVGGATMLRVIKLDTKTGESWAYTEGKNQYPAWLRMDDYHIVSTNSPGSEIDWRLFQAMARTNLSPYYQGQPAPP